MRKTKNESINAVYMQYPDAVIQMQGFFCSLLLSDV